MGEAVRERWVSVRAPRPDVRLDLYGALGATALAVVVYVGALWLRVLPPAGFAVVLFAAAPLLSAVATPIVVARARAEEDEPLAWFGAGLMVALVAMVLQLISFPAVAGPGGGPLGTGNTGSAHLYLLFHAAPPAGVVAAAAGWPARARRWFVIAGCLLAVAATINLLPSPELLRPDLRFTPVLVLAEIVLAAFLAVAAGVWLRQVGRSARPLRGWAGVALSLSCYDVVLNAVAAERYQPVWWASLSLRVAAEAVLAAGAVAAVLAALRRLERYTEIELDRRDAELHRSTEITEQLLSNALAMSRATTVSEVAEALVSSCQEATGLPRASAVVFDEGSGQLRSVARCGYDPLSEQVLQEYPKDARMPGAAALRQGRSLWFATGQELRERFSGLQGLPVHQRTQTLAVLPLLSAGAPVGVLTVSGDEPRAWDAADRELLGGLATQAGQALQRALLFERHRSTAEVLQQGLLPQRLPEVEGVALAARYLAGAAGAMIGGDWYDCLPLSGGRAALVVGDVMGKGVPAAARMAHVRQAVRVLASIDPSPSAVLGGLDALPDDPDEEQIVTLVYVLLDPVAGVARIARAGHVPPILAGSVGRQGPAGPRAVLLEGGSSAPLGVPRVERPEAVVSIGAGDTLVLFTDGLVEDRHTDLDLGLESLVDTIRTLTDDPPDVDRLDVDRLADAVLLARPSGHRQSDDTCLLVARLEASAPAPA